MAQFIKGNRPLLFPRGTIQAYDGTTWAMYTNKALNTTWIGYVVPNGTQIVQLPGIRSRMSADFNSIDAFVKQSQATACGTCGES